MTAADKIEAARALIEPLTGHTPGPWVAEPNAARGAWISGATGEWSALACGDSDESAKRNAALIAAAPALRDTVAALADLADAQAQRVEEWRQDYRALEGAHRVMREANARLIAERDAQAQENARLRDALDPNQTKADYIGEFKQRVCFGTDGDGNEIWKDVTISWDVTKQIMAAIRARAALAEVPA